MKSEQYQNLPFISIVMLNYNGLQYLQKTINAVLKLNYKNYEFIIVDNGSTDGSLDYIKSFKNINLIKSPRLREKNFACNYAIKKATGEYVLLLDNDALIEDFNLLDKLVFESRRKNDFGCFSLAYHNNESSELSIGGYLGYYVSNLAVPRYSIEKKDCMHFKKIGNPSAIGIFIKKELWDSVGGYDEDIIFGCDDKDLGIKIIMTGLNNYLFSLSLLNHIGMAERINNAKYVWKFKYIICADLYLVVKNYSLLNMLITIVVFSAFAFLKSIKEAIFRRYYKAFLVFFYGYFLFIKKLPIAIRKRIDIQKSRKEKRDLFLTIKPFKIL